MGKIWLGPSKDMSTQNLVVTHSSGVNHFIHEAKLIRFKNLRLYANVFFYYLLGITKTLLESEKYYVVHF